MSNYPEEIINNYVWRQFEIDSLLAASASYLGGFDFNSYDNQPFFPVDNVKAGEVWQNKTHVVYDSMFKSRQSRPYFYPIKRGQLMYSIRGSVSEIFKWRDFISDILDREDAAAHDINEYAGQEMGSTRIFFHRLNVNQLNFINHAYKDNPTQRKNHATDLIISYEYHRKVYNE